ncbi:hypothetical protein AURDEDRAFT_160821 [Auricularia subglabra TFB-10046 SS5]|nr:hypothetical protein AURDEDRAFT_160821 [Auricularia subglabra TFB-10046 SS5]
MHVAAAPPVSATTSTPPDAFPQVSRCPQRDFEHRIMGCLLYKYPAPPPLLQSLHPPDLAYRNRLDAFEMNTTMLIPRPYGRVGRPSTGGYCVRSVLGWSVKRYVALRTLLNQLLTCLLDRSLPFSHQDPARVALLCRLACQHDRSLSLYEDVWPIFITMPPVSQAASPLATSLADRAEGFNPLAESCGDPALYHDHASMGYELRAQMLQWEFIPNFGNSAQDEPVRPFFVDYARPGDVLQVHIRHRWTLAMLAAGFDRGNRAATLLGRRAWLADDAVLRHIGRRSTEITQREWMGEAR